VRPPREKGAASRRPRPQELKRPSKFRARKAPAPAAAQNSARATQAPLRAGPGVYIVQMQPGFETIAWSEIVAKIPRAKKLGARTVPERAGMLVFEAPRPEPLGSLRCAEDLFGVIAYRRGFDEATLLEKIRAIVRGCTHLDDALNARVAIVKGARAGKKTALQGGRAAFRRA
jgi:hypothetical protein